jgi:hypothetical protein
LCVDIAGQGRIIDVDRRAVETSCRCKTPAQRSRGFFCLSSYIEPRSGEHGCNCPDDEHPHGHGDHSPQDNALGRSKWLAESLQFKCAAHSTCQLLAREWLGQVVRGPVLHDVYSGGVCQVTRDHNKGKVRLDGLGFF